MKLSQIAKVTAAIEGGRWIRSPLFKGVRHQVKGFNCVAAEEMRVRLIEAIPREERMAGISRERSKEIDDAVIAEVVWLSTEGLTEDDGSAVAITPEKKREILANPELALLRDDIVAAARRVGEDELEQAKADAKN
jgi:hypothetical protein